MTHESFRRLSQIERFRVIDEWIAAHPKRIPKVVYVKPEPIVLPPLPAMAPDDVVDRCLILLGVEQGDFRGPGRQKKVVKAREVVSAVLRAWRPNFVYISYPQIAELMGRPNHSTIVTAIRRWATTWGNPVKHAQELASRVGLADAIDQRIEMLYHEFTDRFKASQEMSYREVMDQEVTTACAYGVCTPNR